ncbi:tRNA synthetases class I, catalytic domain-containing protein [Elsinoe ampelina]|uniref:glutamate--tRNA ligase n=1 Tax=Elsinoe ampelina TaxID=302913 RepID=A0A6A6G4N0_9PEZI|nr:tRNA synthetases class I, catalytic domain-containing protein [Elsinoe ampelina]
MSVQEWQTRAEALKPLNLKEIEKPLAELDSHLTLRTYIVGYTPTDADLTVWKTLRTNRIAHSYIKQNLRPNLCRWFRFIEETIKPEVETARPKAVDDGGNYEIGLQDTEKGVVTRFPPEPSGYLHIGHAKAALLNDYFAHKKYQGKLILRFDDTNPLKEKQEFEDSIVYDLELMGIQPDQVTHTSDYFQELYDFCVEIIKRGKAYADNTPQEQLREERMAKIESSHRNDSVEDNLAHFEEMKSGSPEGQKWYIRAKIDMKDNNGAMRDPVIYRCSPEKHHRTGDRWKIYPTYDFACPLIDAHEGVTHALRTTEYNDRDAQYQWFIKALDLRHVYNWNFARMSFIRTFLSKRKLTKVVDSGLVWGWDDPRFPTVRGIRRRGMTVPALQEFILRQGPSKAITLMDWTSIWATNKKYIDPVAGRYTAVEADNAVECTVTGPNTDAPRSETKDLHAKNKDVGSKEVWYSSRVIVDQADAQSFTDGEEITLMNWGNAYVRNIQKTGDHVTSLSFDLHLEGDVKTTKKKITWLSKDQELHEVLLYDFDYLLTKDKLEEDDDFDSFLNKDTEKRTRCWADVNVGKLREDEIIQFDRKGFFRCDKPVGGEGRARIGGVDGRVGEEVGKKGVFFQIPTGKGK